MFQTIRRSAQSSKGEGGKGGVVYAAGGCVTQISYHTYEKIRCIIIVSANPLGAAPLLWRQRTWEWTIISFGWKRVNFS